MADSDSILISTKKVLNIGTEHSVYDLDIIMHINATFSIINQLGIGPADGFFIEDELAKWEDLQVPANQLSMIKTYIFLKVGLLFDPPGTSFLIEAKNKQLAEYEWRLSLNREALVFNPAEPEEV